MFTNTRNDGETFMGNQIRSQELKGIFLLGGIQLDEESAEQHRAELERLSDLNGLLTDLNMGDLTIVGNPWESGSAEL
jgi:hypothetical protein